jgi:hypothetical protein
VNQRPKRLTLAIVAIAAIAAIGCSKAIPIIPCASADAGGEHDETITVARGSNDYGLDVDQCAASGQCDALCYEVRGKPGWGGRDRDRRAPTHCL